MSPQREFLMIGGPTIRPIQKCPREILGQCKTIGSAVRQALIQSGIQQETMAGWLGVSVGHMSNLLSGKKRFTEDKIRKIVQWTGCDLPAQKWCEGLGGEFWFDAKKAEATALRARADEIESGDSYSGQDRRRA